MIAILLLIAMLLIPLTILRLHLGAPTGRLDAFGRFAARLWFVAFYPRQRDEPAAVETALEVRR